MCQPVEILLHKNGQNVFYQLQEIQGDITDVLCLVNLVIKINELNIYPFVCVCLRKCLPLHDIIL